MAQPKKSFPNEKSELHARNLHRSRYDFPQLIESCPELAPFVSLNKYDDLSVNFSDPEAVKMLNKALLKHFYHIQNWDIPKDFLCPPIPGRADYIHYLADLLSACNGDRIPQGIQFTYWILALVLTASTRLLVISAMGGNLSERTLTRYR